MLIFIFHFNIYYIMQLCLPKKIKETSTILKIILNLVFIFIFYKFYNCHINNYYYNILTMLKKYIH